MYKYNIASITTNMMFHLYIYTTEALYSLVFPVPLSCNIFLIFICIMCIQQPMYIYDIAFM